MQDLEGAISEATEKLTKFENLWPSKEAREIFNPDKILCFVDAKDHSSDAIHVSFQLSREFDCQFSIRSFFDKELLNLAHTDLSHLKESIINIVKDNLKDTGLNKGITFLEGDVIESFEQQLTSEYDMFVLPVPYHSNLSDNPESVSLGSLGEYMVTHLDKPLFLIPKINELSDDLFSSITILVSDVSDIIQNQNYIQSMLRNRSKVHFVFLYNAQDIDKLAIASTGVVDSELVKKRIQSKLDNQGKQTVEKFGEFIENVSFSVFDSDFSNKLEQLNDELKSSLLIISLPENEKSYGYLLFTDILRDRRFKLPILIFHLKKEKPRVEEEEGVETDSNDVALEIVPEEEFSGTSNVDKEFEEKKVK